MLNESDVQINTDLLGQRVLLLSPTMSRWAGRLQLPSSKAEVHMNHQVLDANAVTTPCVKLMTKQYPLDSDGKPWKARFDAISNRLTALKTQYSVGFAITGVRIIPKATASEFMQKLFGPTIGYLTKKVKEYEEQGRNREANELADRIFDARDKWGDFPSSSRTPVYDPTTEQQSIAYEFWDSVLEFVGDYDNVMRQLETRGECWEYVRTKIPKSKEAMFRKFDLGVFPIELSGTAPGQVSMEDLENHADVVRETCQRQVQLAIESMIAEPRRELAETIENIETLIADRGKISTRTFDRVHRAMEKLNNFSFVANAELMTRLQQLNTMLDTTVPARLNDTDAATVASTAQFAAELASIRQELVDPGVMERDLMSLGCHSRAIIFDEDQQE
jgi:hypothetical protein